MQSRKSLLGFSESPVQFRRDLCYLGGVQDRKVVAIDIVNRDAAQRYRTPTQSLILVRIVIVLTRAKHKKMTVVRLWNELSGC
jgi:hypothetical protein